MKVKIGKFDIFMIMIIFSVLTVLTFCLLYFNIWYSVTVWVIGLILILGVYVSILYFIPEKNLTRRFTTHDVMGTLILLISIIGFILLRDFLEEHELKLHGIETVGFINGKGINRSSKYHKVIFFVHGKDGYDSKINENYSQYKLGDTVRVIYSERIPEINRAD